MNALSSFTFWNFPPFKLNELQTAAPWQNGVNHADKNNRIKGLGLERQFGFKGCYVPV